MKLRIKGNTIRLRLTRSEIDYFSDTGSIMEQISFGNSQLTYSLQIADQENLTASFENNIITVAMPASMAKKWTGSNQVGNSAEMEIGNGKKLYLLIEKDFKCLDDTIEDQSDNYENPHAAEHK